MDKLKLIKLIVFILTFLLVFGILSAAGIIYRQVSQTPAAKDISLAQPAGSYIDGYTVNDGKLYILIKGGRTLERIAVVNPSSAEKPVFITLD